ncbi:MAG: efflux RND transporter periplasmic adaptor subunit [Thiobacillaceae bacterium]
MPTPSSNAALFRRASRAGIVLAVVALLLAAWGIVSRIQAQAALNAEARTEAVLPVNVCRPSSGSSGEELILPGSLQAFTETPIYARTNGYLKRWLVDIGSPVKAGQLLAEIDTPEIDQQMAQAEADLQTAEANNDLAQLTARRWRGLLPTNTVSKQDVDNKIGDAAAKQAAVASARANLHRLRDLEGFKRIVAPIDGVITARNTDVGDLIDAGTSSGNAPELFHIAATRSLRVYVQVPESYAEEMHVGSVAVLHVREHPEQTFNARLVRTANAIASGTHTLLVELNVDNATGALLPGGYVEVHFKLRQRPHTLRIPANTLIFDAHGLRVAVVGPDNRVSLQAITLGRDFGQEVEIIAGLKPDQILVVNPPDSLTDGQTVKANVLAELSKGNS